MTVAVSPVVTVEPKMRIRATSASRTAASKRVTTPSRFISRSQMACLRLGRCCSGCWPLSATPAARGVGGQKRERVGQPENLKQALHGRGTRDDHQADVLLCRALLQFEDDAYAA